MLIFRKIEEAYRAVKVNLSLQLPEEEMALELEKMKLLSKIIAYVNSYKWVKQERLKEKIKEFLRSNYDYRAVARKYGVKKNSLEASVSYANKCLTRKIGSALNLVMEGKIEAAEREFLLGTNQLVPSEWFLEGILNLLPEPKQVSGVDLGAAAQELRFLKLMTKKTVVELVETLDSDRLKYLLFVLLRNSSNNVDERDILIRYLDGEIDLKKALYHLKKDYIYA